MPWPHRLPALFSALALLLAPLTGQADVLALYEFNESSLASSDADPGTTAGDIGLGQDASINPVRGFPPPSLAFQCSFVSGTPCGTAAFTLTPAAGIDLSLQSLSFQVDSFRRIGTTWSMSGCLSMTTSLDDYTAVVGNLCWTSNAPLPPNDPILTLDLSGATLQHLNVQSLPAGSLGIRLSATSYGGSVGNCECFGIPLVLDTLTINGVTTPDADLDGIADAADNCTLVANPTQRDTDADGYGSICDPDFNNDGTVNINDFNRLKARLGVTPVVDVDTDLDGNGAVNINDLNRLKSFLGRPPGPSALHPNCPPTCP